MFSAVKTVKPLEGYRLFLTFKNGDEKVFDMNPYLHTGIFSELKDENIFKSVRIVFDTIEWSNGADICPEVLFNESRPV